MADSSRIAKKLAKRARVARAISRSISKLTDDQLREELQKRHINPEGSEAVRRDRLLRFETRRELGDPDIYWGSTDDEWPGEAPAHSSTRIEENAGAGSQDSRKAKPSQAVVIGSKRGRPRKSKNVKMDPNSNQAESEKKSAVERRSADGGMTTPTEVLSDGAPVPPGTVPDFTPAGIMAPLTAPTVEGQRNTPQQPAATGTPPQRKDATEVPSGGRSVAVNHPLSPGSMGRIQAPGAIVHEGKMYIPYDEICALARALENSRPLPEPDSLRFSRITLLDEPTKDMEKCLKPASSKTVKTSIPRVQEASTDEDRIEDEYTDADDESDDRDVADKEVVSEIAKITRSNVGNVPAPMKRDKIRKLPTEPVRHTTKQTKHDERVQTTPRPRVTAESARGSRSPEVRSRARRKRRDRSLTPVKPINSEESSDDSEDDETSEDDEDPTERRKRILKNKEALKCSRILQGWRISFSGRDKTRAADFLARLKECMKTAPIPERTLLKAIPGILHRDASQWYRGAKKNVKTWKDFEAIFRRTYIGLCDRAALEDELRTRRQAKGEKLVDYLAALQQIVLKFKKAPDPRTVLDFAYRNLLPDYRGFLVDKDIFTMDDLEKWCTKWERNIEWDKQLNATSKEKSRESGATATRKPSKKSTSDRGDTEVSGSDQSGKGRKAKRRQRSVAAVASIKEPPTIGAEVSGPLTPGGNDATPQPTTATAYIPVPPPYILPNWPMQNSSPWRQPSRGAQRRPRRNACGNTGAPAAPTTAPVPPAANNARVPPNNAVAAGEGFWGACYHCGVVGHRAATCPQLQCYACRQLGHRARECPSRPPPAQAGPAYSPQPAPPAVQSNYAPRTWGNGPAGGQPSPQPSRPSK